jgi:putative integral membrane protein (TIGR02587 family)
LIASHFSTLCRKSRQLRQGFAPWKTSIKRKGKGVAKKSPDDQAAQKKKSNRDFLTGIVRGFGGALLFSLPILLTMEMWWLGFYAYRWRLFILALTMVPALVILARLSGLKEGASWLENVLEAMTAYVVGLTTAVVVLSLLGIIIPEMPLREIIGKIAILAPFAAFGAVLARSELGASNKASPEQEKFRSTYRAELFMVGAGAFYLAGAVAATQEMVLIAYKMTSWHALALALFEIFSMHAIIYSMNFQGTPMESGHHATWKLLVHYTLPGYVIALLVSTYLLWTFGRFESYSLHWTIMYAIVLGLPASIGGAVGRLVI